MKRLLPFVFVIATFSCNVDGLEFDNIEGPTVNTSIALPIGYVHYTVRELIEEIDDDELDLQEDSTTLLYLFYRDTAAFDSGADIINIEDVIQSASVNLPTTPPDVVQHIVTVDTTFEFSYEAENGEALDSVFYKGGTLQLLFSTNISSDFTYTLTVNNTTEIASQNPVVFSGSQTGPFDPSEELTGHKTDLMRVDALNVFSVDFTMSVILEPGEQLAPGDQVSMTISYLDQEFSLLYGKFGQDTLEVGNQVLDISFFDQLGKNGLEIGNPILSFDFNNSFGLPLGIFFGGLYAVKGEDTTYLEGTVTESAQSIEGSLAPGTSEATQIAVNRENSSIVDFLGISPDQIGFKLNAVTNPVNADALNFVKDDSEIETFIEVTVPMEVRVSDLAREVKIDMGGGINFDEADSVAIRIVTVNEIPLYVLMDLEIIDENDSVLYVAANNQIISTPFLNVDGSLKEPRKTIEDIPLSPQGIDALNAGDRIVMNVLLNSPKSRTGNDIFVKILADYQLDIQISLVGTLKIDL